MRCLPAIPHGVDAGQVLLRLDAADARQALEHAAAELAQTVRQVRQQMAQSVAVRRADPGAPTRAGKGRAGSRPARTAAGRNRPSPAKRCGSARNAVALARAALRQTQEQANAAKALVDHVTLEQNPAVLAAAAAYKDAWRQVQKATIVAPAGGFIAQRSVQLGQRIARANH